MGKNRGGKAPGFGVRLLLCRFSLTPCFSWVRRWHRRQNRFNGLQQSVETVETVPTSFDAVFTQLKQGVNERTSKLRSMDHEICGLVRASRLGGSSARHNGRLF